VVVTEEILVISKIKKALFLVEVLYKTGNRNLAFKAKDNFKQQKHFG